MEVRGLARAGEQPVDESDGLPCFACGYQFDHDALGRYGCPDCHGDGLGDAEHAGLERQRDHREGGTVTNEQNDLAWKRFREGKGKEPSFCMMIQWSALHVDGEGKPICPRCDKPAEQIIGITGDPCYGHIPGGRR